jgi:hypothetical protein
MRSFYLRGLFLPMLLVTIGEGLGAARTCADQDFKGVYSPLNQGNVVFAPLPFLVGPFARTGRAVADGRGGFKAETIDSVNGVIATGEITGTYVVSPNCSLTLNLLVPLPGIPFPLPFTFSGAIADNGHEVTVMPIDPPGVVVPVHMTRQEKSNCSNNDLSGGFLLTMSGSIVLQPPNIPGLFLRVGRAEFDGKGTFSADTHASYAGIVFSEILSGTYSVEQSCLFTIQYTFSDHAYTWKGMLTDNSRKANLMVTDPPGAVVTGTLQQQ